MEIIAVLLCLMLCASGLVLIFDKDRAWQMALWGNSASGLRAQRMERTPQWESFATVRGVITVAASLVMLFSVLSAVHSRGRMGQANQPRAGQTTYTIDGRPATPAEQQIFQQWEDSSASQHGQPPQPRR